MNKQNGVILLCIFQMKSAQSGARLRAMLKCLIHISGLILTQNLYAQNAVDIHGLKIGKWIYRHDDSSTEYGMYLVIPQNKYDSLEGGSGRMREISFNGRTAIQYCTGGRHDTLMSVYSGTWIEQTLSGDAREEDWNDGVLTSRRLYKAGQLVSNEVWRSKSDTDYAVTYEKGRIRDSVLIWDVQGQSQYKHYYYPGGKIYFDHISTAARVNFVTKPRDTVEFRLFAKDNLSLVKCTTSTTALHLYDHDFTPIQAPLNMRAGDTVILKVIYAPSLLTNTGVDTISLFTNVRTDKAYKLHVQTSAFHIDNNTPDTTISLSKTKDRYLLIDGMGTLNSIEIGNKDSVAFRGDLMANGLKLDISSLGIGKYYLNIGGDAMRIHNLSLYIKD